MAETPLGWRWPQPYLETILVKASDTDRLGHTNNVRYLEWLEGIAWGHFESLGCPWHINEALGKAMAITHTEIDYLASSYQGEKLVLGTWITDSNLKLSSSRHFQIFRDSDSKEILRARMDFTCIALATGKPSRMPQEFISAHELGLSQSNIRLPMHSNNQ